MTEAKALILTETNEWATIMEGEIFTSSTPQLLSRTATKQSLERLYPYLNFEELELVDVEVGVLTKR